MDGLDILCGSNEEGNFHVFLTLDLIKYLAHLSVGWKYLDNLMIPVDDTVDRTGVREGTCRLVSSAVAYYILYIIYNM